MAGESARVVEIFTDGACSPNPGPGGWGAVLRYGRHQRRSRRGSGHDQQPHGNHGRHSRPGHLAGSAQSRCVLATAPDVVHGQGAATRCQHTQPCQRDRYIDPRSNRFVFGFRTIAECRPARRLRALYCFGLFTLKTLQAVCGALGLRASTFRFAPGGVRVRPRGPARWCCQHHRPPVVHRDCPMPPRPAGHEPARRH